MKKVLLRTLSIGMCIVVLISALCLNVSAKNQLNLELAFVIDTTGSMEDVVNVIKNNLWNYLDEIEKYTNNYRIALIDYRDFSERTNYMMDYEYKVELDFTSDKTEIYNAVNSLDFGFGGDFEETAYSALMDGVDSLSWNAMSAKSVILISDAPAHNPEPISNYCSEDIIEKFINNNDRSEIRLYSIMTGDSEEGITSFNSLSNDVNGSFYSATTQNLSDTILTIIDDIPCSVYVPTNADRIYGIIRNIIYIVTFRFNKINWSFFY